MASLNAMQARIGEINVEKGWRDEERSFGDICALIHTEISEALEEHRDGRADDEIYFGENVTVPVQALKAILEAARHNIFEKDRDHFEALTKAVRKVEGKPEGKPIEMADALIRILDWFDAVGIDAEKAVQIKMDYNETRPYRHGGKAL